MCRGMRLSLIVGASNSQRYLNGSEVKDSEHHAMADGLNLRGWKIIRHGWWGLESSRLHSESIAPI